VIQCGRIRLGKDRMYYSTVFGGQMVGIREVADRIWLVSFMHFDLGFFDKD
jgi:putative transposase